VSSTRERIVGASAELFRRQGYAGTGMKQIAATAGAQFGSLYHYFPGGKEQLGDEVIRWSGGLYLELIERFFASTGDVASAVEAFFAGAAAHLRDTDYADACPIAAVALDVASTNEPLRAATADVFERWIAAFADRFAAAGLDDPAARTLAISTLAALEGAFVLGRALRDAEPVELAGAAAGATARAALASAHPRG
jgi:AcrR family transcriptional regulator